MKKKRVLCKGHSIVNLTADDRAVTSWCDVWIVFHSSDRKEHYYGPTLISKSSLEWDLKTWKFALSKEDVKPDHVVHLRESIEQENRRLELLRENEFLFEDEDEDVPTIYTRAECINRAEAERMIAAFMKRKGFFNIACDWKVPEFVVSQIG